MKITQTHDTKILSAMVDLLVSSAQGVEDYGFTKTHNQIRYEELASVLNHQGFSNRAGQPLNRNALKQVVHRLRKKPEVLDAFRPNWDDLRGTEGSEDTETTGKDTCLVCGTGAVREKLKTCSPECGGIYQEHKDAPHDPKFPSIFHQMRYEEQFN